jgi:hypothetical protein
MPGHESAVLVLGMLDTDAAACITAAGQLAREIAGFFDAA